ncbi:hypothetical protein HA402_007290 [Bradysia odoriphaga]|nr:hypothetical protein HA402_007290 [Bradysia odoriphaga]
MSVDENVAINSQQQNHDNVVTRLPLPDKVLSSDTVISNGSKSFLPEEIASTMSFLQKVGYGLGHVHNDLCAGVWFSYTLLFMQGALQMSGALAGTLVMLGQVGDALATPIVGILTDKYYTKRKWHIAGTCLIFLTFPLIYSICPWCTTGPVWWMPIYFSAVILLFQSGWAIVQITHMAMIPELSETRKDRDDLTAIRYSVSVCSNVVVYIVTWLILKERAQGESNIGPGDSYRFRNVSLILSLIGVLVTVVFHFSLSASGYNHRRKLALERHRRPSVTKDLLNKSDAKISSDGSPASDRLKILLKSPLLYQNAFLYVFSRLFMCTALVYIPLWLDERTMISESETTSETGSKSVEHIATIPLISFLSSFIASMAMKYSNRIFGHRVAYLLGSILCISGCVWVASAAPPTASSSHLYSIAVLFGAGSSITMISSLCITAKMIGKNADQGGFIYSAVTFADKLITGIVVLIIETIKCDKRSECLEYYKDVLAYACGAATVLGLLTLATLQSSRKTTKRQI